MDTSVLVDTAVAVVTASSSFDWKYLIHRALTAATDPAVMVYLAAGAAGVVAWVRSRVSSKKQIAMDLVVYAFGHVEKAFDVLAKDKKAKYNKEMEFAKLFAKSYQERTGVKPNSDMLRNAVAQAAKLALEKKLRK